MIWIALSIGMLALLLFSLMSMSKQQDHATRRIENNPQSVQRGRIHHHRVKRLHHAEGGPTSNAGRPAAG
jgi:hypothetical protein